MLTAALLECLTERRDVSWLRPITDAEWRIVRLYYKTWEQ